jgi:hypothetical protein
LSIISKNQPAAKKAPFIRGVSLHPMNYIPSATHDGDSQQVWLKRSEKFAEDLNIESVCDNIDEQGPTPKSHTNGINNSRGSRNRFRPTFDDVKHNNSCLEQQPVKNVVSFQITTTIKTGFAVFGKNNRRNL